MRRPTGPVGRTLAVAGALSVGVSTLGACGVDTGADTFREIPDEEVPFGLNQVSTTTTSTTTTTTLPDAPTTSTTTADPVEAIAEVPVEVFFVARDELQPVLRTLTAQFGPNQLADLLESGPPPGTAGVGLTSFIEEGLLDPGVPVDGVIEIGLDEERFDQIDSSDQTEAIAQIVLTFTENLGRVGFVQFTLGGRPLRVIKGNGLLSEEGEALSFDDYAVLLAGQSDVPTTTAATSTTLPGTTVPG